MILLLPSPLPLVPHARLGPIQVALLLLFAIWRCSARCEVLCKEFYRAHDSAFKGRTAHSGLGGGVGEVGEVENVAWCAPTLAEPLPLYGNVPPVTG